MMNIDSSQLKVHSSLYGKLNNADVYKFSLQNGKITVDVTNLGCVISAIYTPDRNGIIKNITAGFADLSQYEKNGDYFGCILGRYANRIAGGKFNLNGKDISLSVNEGINHLHGGVNGFDKKIWHINSFFTNSEEACVVFNYLSPNDEEGYPGNLAVEVKYILNKKNQFIIEYRAHTDKATPVNLSNHTYFNLTGFENGKITDHLLQVNATKFTEKNGDNLPTGKIVPVAGTALDFLTLKKIGDNINELTLDKGFDHNFIVNDAAPGKVVLAAVLKEPLTGRTLKLYTSQHSLQVYTANLWNGTTLGSQGFYYQQHGAVALETQSAPDSPNHALFPDTILNPGEEYFSTTIYEFGADEFSNTSDNIKSKAKSLALVSADTG